MIKYTRLNRSSILLESTSNKLKRKTKLMKNKFMIDIIQKINFFKRRLNFFDYAVLFVLISILVFFIYNRLQRQETWINVRVSVENADWWYHGDAPAYWYLNDIKTGDAIKNSLGQEVAKVTNVENYDLGGYSRLIYVDLKLKVDFDQKKNQYLYEFKPLVVGSSLAVNFSNQQLKGLVISIGDKEIEYTDKTIKVEMRNIAPSLAEKVIIGTKSYDINGNVTAEILDVKKNIASNYNFSDIRAQKIKVFDPEYRDLEVTLRVKTFRELDRDFYINKAVLKIGARIWFQFTDFALEDTKIIEIID